MRIHLLLLIFFCLFNTIHRAPAQIYGLSFNGQEEVLDNRTELILTPEKPISVKGELELGFDLMIKPALQRSYGYVFRIVDQNNFNIDVINSYENGGFNLFIVHGNENSVINVPVEKYNIGKWMKLRMKLMVNESKLIFYTPDSFYVVENLPLKIKNKYNISFGASSIKGFSTTDVSAMNIKDVNISIDGRVKYHWNLDLFDGSIVRDSFDGQTAEVRNPVWLKKVHSKWGHLYGDVQNGSVIITSDPKSGRIFIIGEESIGIFSMKDNTIRQISYTNKPFVKLKGCSAIYHVSQEKLLIYDIDEKQIFWVDMNGNWFGEPSKRKYETTYLHHNVFFNEKSNKLTLFGGYGQHNYKNEVQFFDIENLQHNTIEPHKSLFSPRYLAALGILNDTVYILGGYGSKTGSQMINPQSNYELLAYTIKDSAFLKVHQIPQIIPDMCMANSMVIDDEQRNFYALGFDKSKTNGVLQLIKGSIHKPEVCLVGSAIPYKFVDINSYASLIYSEIQNKLYTVTAFLNSENQTEVEIYALNYPPSAISSVDELVNKQTVQQSKWILYVVISITILGLFLLIALRYKASTNQVKQPKVLKPELTEEEVKEPILEVEQEKEQQEIYENNYHVVFFGGFQMMNAQLEDITNKFTPLLKELFLLVWLYSFKNNMGIQSDSINEILWPDKTDKSAKNNRAVNFAKLRTLLSELGNVQLSKKTGYWKITFNDDLKSDYVDFLELTESKYNLNEKKVEHLIQILSKGAFLRNAEYEWLDDFKAMVSDRIIEILVDYAKNNVIKQPELIIKIANCIFNFDVINEEALIMKCKAQCLLGQHGLAKKTYEQFGREYKLLYGDAYNSSFSDVVS